MSTAIRVETAPVEGGNIVYDAVQVDHMHEHVFALSYWRTRDALSEPLGGRGAAFRIRDRDIDWVLRFYRRGGLPGKFIDDSYFYTGLERSRAWREWRLLADLHARGLPVPRPVAARVWRNGLTYRAAIITATVPGTPLAKLITGDRLADETWRAVGRCIRQFHDAGVWHADLNAHNILVTDSGENIFLIDFDRGRLRTPDKAWQEANLARLERSLRKIAPQRDSTITAGMGVLKAAWRG